MKKFALLFVALATLSFFGASAQDTIVRVVEKTYYKPSTPDLNTLLPRARDFGIILNVDPVFDFVGNLFTRDGSNTFSNRWSRQTYALGVRYFVTDKIAVRGSFVFNPDGNESTTEFMLEPDHAKYIKDNTSREQVTNSVHTSRNDYGFALGAQFYHGWKRLRGFYGADFNCRIRSESATYKWGQAISEDWGGPFDPRATVPVSDYDKLGTSVFGQSVEPIVGEGRTLEYNGSHTTYLSLNLFGGFEYYLYQHLCIGFEVGLELGGTIGGTPYLKYEFWDPSTNSLKVETEKSAQNSTSFKFTTSSMKNIVGSHLYMAFDF